jgi:hypothetical protein
MVGGVAVLGRPGTGVIGQHEASPGKLNMLGVAPGRIVWAQQDCDPSRLENRHHRKGEVDRRVGEDGDTVAAAKSAGPEHGGPPLHRTLRVHVRNPRFATVDLAKKRGIRRLAGDPRERPHDGPPLRPTVLDPMAW